MVLKIFLHLKINPGDPKYKIRPKIGKTHKKNGSLKIQKKIFDNYGYTKFHYIPLHSITGF